MNTSHDYLIALLEKVEADLLTAKSVAHELMRDNCLPSQTSAYINLLSRDAVIVRRSVVALSKMAKG